VALLDGHPSRLLTLYSLLSGLRIDQMDELFGFVRPGTDYPAKAFGEDDEARYIDEKQRAEARLEVV